MAHEIETMAYVGEAPWHGLGRELQEGATPAEMCKAAGLEWDVVKVPLKYVVNGKTYDSSDWFGLVRETDGTLLSTAGKDYIPIQNRQIFEFFDRYVSAGKMKMETAGSLRGGKHVWALAKFSDGFTLPGDDQVQGYLLFSQPHEYGQAMTIKMTPIRVVCHNTITMALRDSRGEANAFRMMHTREFNNDLMKEVEETVGLAARMMKDFEKDARLLAKSHVRNEHNVTHFVAEMFQPELLKGESLLEKVELDVPRPLLKKIQVDPIQFKLNARRAYAAVTHSPGAALKAARGTWWGVYNAVTYMVDHMLGRERDSALNNAWFGERSSLKTKALKRAVELAKEESEEK